MGTVGDKQVADGLDEGLDEGFVGWVERLAAELYAAGCGLYGVDEPVGYAACRDFLLSQNALGSEECFIGVLPGFYLHGQYHGRERRAGENLLYLIWETAWAGDEGHHERQLRVISLVDPHEGGGEVIGLDLTHSEGSPKGTVVFYEKPHMADLICSSETELLDLYRWAEPG